MSTVKTNNILDASGGNTATINSMTPTADSLQGFRNRIINGDMRIDQRNAGAAVSNPGDSTVYLVDRWNQRENTAAQLSFQQVSDGPAGFVNSMKVTVTTADASIGASDYSVFRQFIEATNTADLGWGSASAKTITLSFWVKSSVTGTYGGRLANDAVNRIYVFTYTISAANTWEYKTITIAGDTSGTWLTDTSIGIRVDFCLTAGTDWSGSAGSWGSTNYFTVTGNTPLISTLNATWYVTGVQLEVGSVATPFERRPYGTELFLCQRYYWVYTSNNNYIGILQAYSTSEVYGVLVDIPVPMRATPSVSQSGSFAAYRADSGNAGLATTIGGLGTNGQNIQTNGWTGGSGLVAGHAAVFQGSTGAKLIASAEL
jgi:hypothetical protein